MTRHSKSTARLERTPLSYDSHAPVQLDEATTPFRAVFSVLSHSFFSAYLHTYSPNHALIGLFRAPKWAKHGQCCGGRCLQARSPAAFATPGREATRDTVACGSSQGKREAADELLAQVYNWFTEGFDTTDLQEANALEELQGSNTSARAPRQEGVGLLPEVVRRLRPSLAAYISSETLYFANHVVSNTRRAWL